MRYKKLLWVLLIFAINYLAKAQNILVEDVVYTKNGSVIRGLIVEEVPLVSIKIMTADRSVFVFKIDEIEKIEHVYGIKPKHPALFDSPQGGIGTSSVFEEPLTKWTMGLEYGYSGSLRNIEVGNIHGLYGLVRYSLTPMMSAAFGFGIEDLQYIHWVPLFADFNLKINNQSQSPYFYGRMGINIPTGEENYYNDFDAGLLAGFGLGFRMRMSPSLNFNASIGYRYQHVAYRSYIYPEPYPYPKPLPGTEIINGGINTGTDPNGQPITNEPPYPDPDPNIWPPIYWEPVKIISHGHFISFTFGISF
ncbi:MAG: hypothetical protein PWR20_2479 [Bacteroidales bacterium]|jgi:hypothetical protein|nr:hypothetical protein [Bacteroidales bacterium]MDN5328758.1 hypothetical protein [Bacteroidales bacterium]